MPDETPAPPPDFESALAELQRIVADLEEGNVGLEQSLARFERGVRLLRHCSQVLEHAEQRIEILTRIGPDGEIRTTPFDATATADREPRTTTAEKRRPQPRKLPPGGVDEDNDRILF